MHSIQNTRTGPQCHEPRFSQELDPKEDSINLLRTIDKTIYRMKEIKTKANKSEQEPVEMGTATGKAVR